MIRAPASTANLGPGFDCAAAALDLWNELHVLPAADGEPLVTLEGLGAGELPTDASHLALRAFALASPIKGHRFHFVNRIPLERGLGSAAATVAAGITAGRVAAGGDASLDEVLELALPLEGHADNLAAALQGGVCLIWRDDSRYSIRRIAEDLPLAAILVVPNSRVNTSESRSRLPEFIRHEDATEAAARAALLGAGIAAGDPDLLAAAFHDRLHEPFRAPDARLLGELRAAPVTGQAGVTLSGSGPTVVVWVEKAKADAAVAELEERADAEVVPLAIASRGTYAEQLPTSETQPIGAAT